MANSKGKDFINMKSIASICTLSRSRQLYIYILTFKILSLITKLIPVKVTRTPEIEVTAGRINDSPLGLHCPVQA